MGEVLTVLPDEGGVDAVAAATRRIIDALMSVDRGAEGLADVAAQLDAIAARLAACPAVERGDWASGWVSGPGRRSDPVTSPGHPYAPPITLVGRADGSVSGVVTLGLAYQGPPGSVHGGVSALILDHVLGVANHWGGTSGFTGTLSLRYVRRAPLFEELEVSARQESVQGRKIRTVGTISHLGRVCVEAEGLFVVPRELV